jgi:hypothetical protein
VTFRFRRYRLTASALHLHLLLMEEPDGRMWWACEYRTDVFRPGEAGTLVRAVLGDTAALLERPGEPIGTVIN